VDTNASALSLVELPIEPGSETQDWGEKEGQLKKRAQVISVKEGLVSIDISHTSVMKNEVGYVVVGTERLKAEVLRVQGDTADMQVFEDTRGVRIGDEVELSNELLSIALGPGLLGNVYDGLQNPLSVLAESHGFFLPRGVYAAPLNPERKWNFEPALATGDQVSAGMPLGMTREGGFTHKIMAPFGMVRAARLAWIADSGAYTINDTIARLKLENGKEVSVAMHQRWPVRRSMSESMLAHRLAERLYPSEPLTTQQRIIDTFLPIARGGTGCIPGPFGAGKTVLQSLIARHSTIDVVIIIACGERAGEVVETIKEYPETIDPRTGGSLMDRTIIVCNTSSMPVAARESSIYTGITLGEYYRQMGYHVLCIADSTSRWAQAMRETSGRMEEIPGEEAFPAYLDSAIKGVYERAGVLRTPDSSVGSVTLIGTVSPAGGNFEEPVTQATLATVKTFLGLSYDRAYRRFYPAIDPLISWSRYLDQLKPWFESNLGPDWVPGVKKLVKLLHDSDTIYQMMQVTGEEGISEEDFVIWQKAILLDSTFLQQDAFDAVDSATPRERQKFSLKLLQAIIDAKFRFDSKDAARSFFTKLTASYKNWNYSATETPDYVKYLQMILALAKEHTVGNLDVMPIEP
jgi:V/A-type H+/Na+-transporting ATPase subunit A